MLAQSNLFGSAHYDLCAAGNPAHRVNLFLEKLGSPKGVPRTISS